MIDKLLLTCLQRNKRLVIPTLGAFIRKSVDGVGVILVFVPFLKEDDGVLLNAFKEWAGVNSEDAKSMLNEYVAHINSTLEKRGAYVIEGIGVLKYDANNSLYLAKDAPMPKAETKAPEAAPAKKEEIAEPEKVEVVTKPVVAQPVETPAPAPVQAHEPERAPEPTQPQAINQSLNSQISQTVAGQAVAQAPQTPNTSLNNQFSQQTQNQQRPQTQYEQPAQPSLNETAKPTYKKVVTGGGNYNEQRGNSNIGEFYFSGNENNSTVEVPEETQINAQQPQRNIAQQYQQGVNPNQGNAYGQQPQRTSSNEQSKMNALYGSNKRTVTNQPAQTQKKPINQQAKKPQKPTQSSKNGKPKQEMTLSAKLIWILAIVAIVLTVSVIIYAFIYGGEVTLQEEVQIDNFEQPVELPTDADSLL